MEQTKSMMEDIEREANELLPSLPKAMKGSSFELCFHQGVWLANNIIPLSYYMYNQRFFEAQGDDIIIVTFRKAGTTWIKALTFSVVNRTRYTPSNSPLLTTNPHHLVPYLTSRLVMGPGALLDTSTLPSHRILGTHLPYSALPESIKQSNCSVVYLCRNPFDSALSLWHFFRHWKREDFDMSLEDHMETYFKGVSWYGPYWDHVLGYWKESLRKPNKVLFLNYEDLKEDCITGLKKLVEFLKCPFSEEEERNGVIEEISKLCSFEKLHNLEVNKNGMYLDSKPNKAFFSERCSWEWNQQPKPFQEAIFAISYGRKIARIRFVFEGFQSISIK